MLTIAGMTLYEIGWYFLIYSVIGWMLEVVYHAVTLGKVINRGFLNGPVCPVYGFGVLAVFAMCNIIGDLGGTGQSMSEVNSFYIFIGGTILASAVELIAGWLLFHCFHARWWDYSNKPFNLGGYICPQFSLLWGLGAVLIVRVAHPGIDQISASYIPERIGIPILLVLYAIYLADFLVTVLIVIGLNKKLKELDQIRSDMRIVSDAVSEKLGERTIDTTVFIQEQQVQAALARAELHEKAQESRQAASARATAVKEKTAARMTAARTSAAEKVASAKDTTTEKVVNAKETAALKAVNAKEAAVTKATKAREAAGERIAQTKNAAEAKASAAKENAAARVNGSIAALEARYHALKHSIMKNRFFGAKRLLMAFPDLTHSRYSAVLQELQKELTQDDAAHTADDKRQGDDR